MIAVDPPWKYDAEAEDNTHRAANPYPSMTIAEIKALDVAQVSAGPDCVLWLWTTNAHMREAFGILDAWGFTFKTILTWMKNKMGTGDWLRGQTEHCLMAIRGKPVIHLTNQTTALSGPCGSIRRSRKSSINSSRSCVLAASWKCSLVRNEKDGWDMGMKHSREWEFSVSGEKLFREFLKKGRLFHCANIIDRQWRSTAACRVDEKPHSSRRPCIEARTITVD